MLRRLIAPSRLAYLIPIALLAASCEDHRPLGSHTPGQTDFTTLEYGNGSSNGIGRGGPEYAGDTGGGAVPAPSAPSGAPAPSGRVGQVQEADIYKLDGTRLFYLNTYRGFMVYDAANPKQPVLLSRLPVYGYPVEMFVEGSTVYALLRDALYLTQVDGKLQFQRHRVSQLVTIDVSDVHNPRVLKTMDIIGQLHEGVSRKIENTIYVVSEQWGGYYWGWPGEGAEVTEQAWVYSYDVSNPADPRQVGQLQIFEGGNYSTYANNGGTSYASRYFSGVAISATSNALMVVENWWAYGDTGTGCGSSTQEAVVSVIDISDPTGVIRRHSRFQTAGALDDQFKMTYVFDDATQRGTFYGIFAQQAWTNCVSVVQNTLESWDITDGADPRRLAALSFGKEGETVRASAYDVSRKVVYAITARQIDPLYAISIADPAAPRVLSAIDGLSGSVSVFRTVAGGQFLLGVGQDTSETCTGFQDGDPTWRNTNMALSIIDVRELANIRLVQRKCVAVENAAWTSSSINWNLDQAHKMLGMFQDGAVNVITVPVSYAKQESLDDGWWYHWETAVGLMTWDLSRYDEAKQPAEQTVIQSFGTFVHPQGEVARSIIFRHPGTAQRTMINLSDTHMSIANIEDLAQPRLESVVEVAPAVSEVYGFGGYVVERVDTTGSRSYTDGGMSEFRVKVAGGAIDERAPVASFRVGQVSFVRRFKNNLVVYRYVWDPTGTTPATSEAVVFDLSNPASPRRAGRTAIPLLSYYYPWGFYCGLDFWGGYWFGGGETIVETNEGLVQLQTEAAWDGSQYTYTNKMWLLDLRDVDAPAVREREISRTTDWQTLRLVADPADPRGFYLSHREVVGTRNVNDSTLFTEFRYYAQRWDAVGGQLVPGANINVPGPLARTWVDGNGTRMFLTYDWSYRTITLPDRSEWHSDTRLNLLRQMGALAEWRDGRTFEDQSLSSFVIDNDRLFVVGQQLYYWWAYDAAAGASAPIWEVTSDRLMAFDMSQQTLRSVYDQPTHTYGVQLMGTHGGRLFVALPGDGVLMADIADASAPRGLTFLRTLGWNTHVEFAGNEAYVASGYFGVFHLDTTAPASIPVASGI